MRREEVVELVVGIGIGAALWLFFTIKILAWLLSFIPFVQPYLNYIISALFGIVYVLVTIFQFLLLDDEGGEGLAAGFWIGVFGIWAVSQNALLNLIK